MLFRMERALADLMTAEMLLATWLGNAFSDFRSLHISAISMIDYPKN